MPLPIIQPTLPANTAPAAQSTKLTALQNLANNLPVANQRLATGQQAARNIQLQNAVAKAPTAAPTTSSAQQTGAAIAANAGAQQVQNAQNTVQQEGQVGQTGMATQNQQNQADVSSQEAGAKQQQMDETERFAKLDAGLKKQLYDDNMKFQKDDLGRTQFNATQLSDYARANATSNDQYQNYAQSAKQLSDRKLQVMQQAYNLAMEDLKQKQIIAEQNKDQQSQIELALMKRGMDQQMAKETAKQANNAAAWQTGGMILGAAGGAFGGPQGAAVGGSVGSALGSLASGL